MRNYQLLDNAGGNPVTLSAEDIANYFSNPLKLGNDAIVIGGLTFVLNPNGRLYAAVVEESE